MKEEAATKRFDSIHRRRPFVELYQVSASVIFTIGFLPPLFAAFFVIVAAVFFHQHKITNYVWTCGRAFLPSLSRIINLPLEGLVWQLFIFFHVPFRIVELSVGFVRYGRLESTHSTWRRWYTLNRYLYLIFGCLELLFLTGLSAVGEKEQGVVHVTFFYSFGIFAVLFFLSNTICHNQSLYYLHPYGRFSYYTKVALTVLYFSSAPLIATFYMLYWKACIKIAYELFALTEYIDVFLVIFYHGCAFFDIRHKVIFSVRLEVPERKAVEHHVNVEKHELDQVKNNM